MAGKQIDKLHRLILMTDAQGFYLVSNLIREISDFKQHAVFFSKLLDYLNMEPFDDPPKAQKMVGIENVRSQTRQGQVHVPEKVEAPVKGGSQAGGPDAQVDSEIQRWMQGKQPEEPKKPDVKVKTQLVHIGVKEFSSRGKGRHFGYIITGSE